MPLGCAKIEILRNKVTNLPVQHVPRIVKTYFRKSDYIKIDLHVNLNTFV